LVYNDKNLIIQALEIKKRLIRSLIANSPVNEYERVCIFKLHQF